MKRILTALILTGLLALPVIASAQEPPAPGELTWTSFYTNVTAAIWWIFAFFAIVMFVVAGVMFLTAGGDPDKIGKARNAFIWGIIGIIVAVLGYSIIRIVKYLIGRW